MYMKSFLCPSVPRNSGFLLCPSVPILGTPDGIPMQGITRQGSYRAREVNSGNDSTTNATKKQKLPSFAYLKKFETNSLCITLINMKNV